MDVLITGGTGFIGARLCRELHERDHGVTALARSPEIDDLPSAIDVVQGDVTEYESIIDAFERIDVVVNLVALSPLFEPKGGEQMHDIVHRGGTENVVRAAEAHDVTRIVQLSAVNANPDGETAYLRAKGQAEVIVRGLGLEYVILRPSVVFGDGGEFVSFTRTVAPPYITPLPGGGRTRFQPIWIDDLVPMIADAVTEDAHNGSIYAIGGPEVLTLAEIARSAHAAMDRPATVLPIPMGLARLGMTLGGAIPGFPFGPDQYRSLQMDLVVDSNEVGSFGVSSDDLTTFLEYLDEGAERGRSSIERTERPDQSTLP